MHLLSVRNTMQCVLWSGKRPTDRELVVRVGKDCLFRLSGPNLRVSTVREGRNHVETSQFY